jgi:hypothetical protein
MVVQKKLMAKREIVTWIQPLSLAPLNKLLNIILANKTFQYIVIQRFGKFSARFKKSLKIILPLTWIYWANLSEEVRIGTIASANQDFCPKCQKKLQKEGVLL